MAMLQKGAHLKKLSLWIPNQQLFTVKRPWSEEALKSLVLPSGLFWTQAQPQHRQLSVSRYLCWVSDMGWTIYPVLQNTFLFFIFNLFFGNKPSPPDLSFWGRNIPITLLTFYNYWNSFATKPVPPVTPAISAGVFFLEEKISHFLSGFYFLKCLPFFFAFSRLQHIFVWWQNWAEPSNCSIFL